MNVVWLVANNAYAILCGETIIDIDGKRCFRTIKELKECIKHKGLTVKNGRIETIKEDC